MNTWKAWTSNPDETLKKTNIFAVMLAVNQLLYAPSLALFVGWEGLGAWPVAFSAPVFVATLWISRRHALAAKIWLPLAGIFDTVLAQMTMGYDTGVWVFFLPSLTLAVCLFDRRERRPLALLGTLALAAFVFLPEGKQVFDPATAATIARINAGSAITLTAFIGWVFSRSSAR